MPRPVSPSQTAAMPCLGVVCSTRRDVLAGGSLQIGQFRSSITTVGRFAGQLQDASLRVSGQVWPFLQAWSEQVWVSGGV